MCFNIRNTAGGIGCPADTCLAERWPIKVSFDKCCREYGQPSKGHETAAFGLAFRLEEEEEEEDATVEDRGASEVWPKGMKEADRWSSKNEAPWLHAEAWG